MRIDTRIRRVLLLLVLAELGEAASRAQVSPQPRSPRVVIETAVRLYFQAVSTRDLSAFDQSWSRNSVDRWWHYRTIEVAKLRGETTTVDGLAIRGVRFTGAGAVATVTAEVSRTDVAGKKTSGPVSCSFELLSQRGQWKIRQMTTDFDRRAETLLASSEAEQDLMVTNGRVGPFLADSIIRLADKLDTRGDAKAAIRLSEVARASFDRVHDRIRVGDALLVSANAHLSVSETDLATRIAEQALFLFTELNDRVGSAKSHLTIGRIQIARGRLESGLDHLRQAAEIAEPAGDSILARVLVSAAGPEMDQGHFKLAFADVTKAQAMSAKTGDDAMRARALHNLGDLYIEQRNFDLALASLQEALTLKIRLHEKASAANTMHSIAVAHIYQGHCLIARRFLQQSLKDAQDTDDRMGQGYILNELGTCYNVAGQPGRALEFHARALEASKGTGENSSDDSNLAAIMCNLAEESRQLKRYDDASRYVEQALATAQRIGDMGLMWQAQTIAGNTLLDRGRPTEARSRLEDAIRIVEILRAEVGGPEQTEQSFFSDKLAPYHLMIRSYLDEHDSTTALRFAERSKARLLLDILRSGRTMNDSKMTAAERSRETQLREQLATVNREFLVARQADKPDAASLAKLGRQLESARVDLQSFVANLFATHPELRIKRGEVSWDGPASLNTFLQNGSTAILEFVAGESGTDLLVLTRAAPPAAEPTLKAYRLEIGRVQLTSAVRRFRDQLAHRDPGFVPAAQALYGKLIAPASGQLKGIKSLVIVPDGPLWGLPFQALMHDRRYLVEDAAIVFAPSLAVLQQARDAAGSTPPSNLLAFGNPRLDAKVRQVVQDQLRGTRLDLLPEAETEVLTLGQLYGAANSKVYTGPEALESRWKAEAPKYGILHIAAHGVRDDAHPLYSYLALSRANESDSEDGLLEAWEIMELKLRASLAVLSGCDTAGDERDGEGIVGLAWAFFVAGTPTTIASQWSVQSESTSELMIAFHRSLLHSRDAFGTALPKARALRNAELEMLRSQKYAHPFYWAPFITIATQL